MLQGFEESWLLFTRVCLSSGVSWLSRWGGLLLISWSSWWSWSSCRPRGSRGSRGRHGPFGRHGCHGAPSLLGDQCWHKLCKLVIGRPSLPTRRTAFLFKHYNTIHVQHQPRATSNACVRMSFCLNACVFRASRRQPLSDSKGCSNRHLSVDANSC